MPFIIVAIIVGIAIAIGLATLIDMFNDHYDTTDHGDWH